MTKPGGSLTTKKPTYTNVHWEPLDDPEGWKLKHEKEHKLRLDAELETSLVKAIGQNSPEMKALQKKVEELKADLARAKEDHQFDNLVHKRELEKMSK